MRARSSNWIEQGTPKPKGASSILAGRRLLKGKDALLLAKLGKVSDEIVLANGVRSVLAWEVERASGPFYSCL